MKIRIFAISVLAGLLVQGVPSQSKIVFEHKLPPGWMFRKAAISPSGERAIFLFQDLPSEARLAGNIEKRLQLFDKNSNLTADLAMDDYWLSDFTRDSRVILTQGTEEGVSRIKVIDLNGKELFNVPSEGRFPEPALLGGEISLIPRQGQIGPISIIDGETGRELFRYEAVTVKPVEADYTCFLSIGKDGLFIVGMGATISLKSYVAGVKTIWRIQDIGGNIVDSRFLNDEFLAVEYERRDYKADKFQRGVAIIRWRTGEILFNKQGSQIAQQPDSWYYLLSARNIFLQDGALVFPGNEGNGVLIPRRPGNGAGWDKDAPKLVKRADEPKNDPNKTPRYRQKINGIYIIDEGGDTIRIEKLRYVDR